MNNEALNKIIEFLELEKDRSLVKIEASEERKEQVRKENLEFDKKRVDELKAGLKSEGFDIEKLSAYDVLSELAERWEELTK